MDRKDSGCCHHSCDSPPCRNKIRRYCTDPALVYYHFSDAIRDTERRRVENPLVYRDGRYAMDLEEKVRTENVGAVMLCSPHNPTGRVWKQEELEQIGRICERQNVIVIANEIHCDYVRNGYTLFPF